MAAHAHAFCELIVPLSGQMRVHIAGQTFHATRGDALFYPTAQPHEEWSDPRSPATTLFASFYWPAAPAATPYHITDPSERILQAMHWLFADRDLPTSPQLLAQRHQTLLFILSRLTWCGRSLGPGDALVHTIRSFIRQHLATPINLDALARLADMSKFHFLRHYTRLTGRSPMEDVRALRMEHARDLLLHSDLPLKQIAPRCGVGSEFALSRAFKRHFGFPPSQLRH
jgi:AraC-like DNA-binding protein